MDFLTTPIKDFLDDPAIWTGFRLFLAGENGHGFDYEPSAANTFDYDFKNILVGDFNGDGRSDFVSYNTYQGNPLYDIYALFISEENNGVISFNRQDVFFKIVDKNYEHEMLTGDFNGDGISDLYFRDDEGSYNDFLLGTSTGDFIEHSHFASGTGKVQVYGDYNGDGIDDFVLFNGTSCFLFQIELTPGEIYTPEFESLSGSYSFELPDDRIYRFGDFNGDGKTDIIVFGIEGGLPWSVWHIYFANGNRSERIMFDSKRSDVTDHRIEIHDFNADGKSDILIIAGDNTGWEGRELFLANNAGTDFIQADEGPIHPSVGQRFYFGDFSGDGAAEFFVVDNDKGQALSYWKGYQLYHKGRQIKDLITKVTDGLGLQTRLVYKPLTDNSVYTKLNTATYPLSDIEAPLFVVDSVLRENGSGNFLSTKYQYTGAVIHKQGKGFLGFQKIEATDNETGIKTILEFDFDNPYFFPEQKLAERFYNNTSIEKSSFVYDYKTISEMKVFFPYVSESTVESKKLDGTLYNTTVSTFSYDDYGNVLTTGINYNNGFATEASTNQFDNIITIDKWHLGRLRRSVVTKTRYGESPVTRVSAFEYNSGTGLLEKEIVEPDNSTYRYEKIYTHDDFGNIEETRYTTSGLADRVTTSVYDTKGRFEVQTENTLGHVSVKVYEDFFGNVTQAVSANGLMTQFVYDDFGNLLKTVAPDGNVAVSTQLWVESEDADAPARAVYYSWGRLQEDP